MQLIFLFLYICTINVKQNTNKMQINEKINFWQWWNVQTRRTKTLIKNEYCKRKEEKPNTFHFRIHRKNFNIEEHKIICNICGIDFDFNTYEEAPGK